MPNPLNNIELRSEEVQEILEATPVWMIRWGNILILLLILILLFISWFIKYPDIINSSALITTQLPPQKEYAKLSGKLEALLIKDNQEIIEETPLAILENTANYKDVFYLKSITDTLKINNKSFYFPIDSLPILFLGDIETQFALFENSYRQYEINKKYQPFSNQAIANQYTITELNRRLQTLKSQKEDNKKELEYAKKYLERKKSLYDKGIIPAQEFENDQRQFAQSERNYKSFESSISQIKEGISNAQTANKGTKVNKIREEMTLLKNVIQSFNQLKKAIKDWENLYVFKSNINGNVSFLDYWTINQTINQGDLVFTIIPSKNSSFIAKLKTPALNSGKIKIGQQVNIKLENYPDTEYGVINGTVKKISAIPNNDGFYIIDVTLPKELITSYKKTIDFKNEMQGSAEIVTEDLRLIERFFYQLKNILKN